MAYYRSRRCYLCWAARVLGRGRSAAASCTTTALCTSARVRVIVSIHSTAAAAPYLRPYKPYALHIYHCFSSGDLLRAERDSGSPDGAMITQYINEGKIVPVEVRAAGGCSA